MSDIAALGLRWLRLGLPVVPMRHPHTSEPGQRAVEGLRVACPHCTNTDTLTRHCPDDRCGLVS